MVARGGIDECAGEGAVLPRHQAGPQSARPAPVGEVVGENYRMSRMVAALGCRPPGPLPRRWPGRDDEQYPAQAVTGVKPPRSDARTKRAPAAMRSPPDFPRRGSDLGAAPCHPPSPAYSPSSPCGAALQGLVFAAQGRHSAHERWPALHLVPCAVAGFLALVPAWCRSPSGLVAVVERFPLVPRRARPHLHCPAGGGGRVRRVARRVRVLHESLVSFDELPELWRRGPHSASSATSCWDGSWSAWPRAGFWPSAPSATACIARPGGTCDGAGAPGRPFGAAQSALPLQRAQFRSRAGCTATQRPPNAPDPQPVGTAAPPA